MDVGRLPFEVAHELPGWTLYWALLQPADTDRQALDDLLAETACSARTRYSLDTLATQPVVAELRRLFRVAGTDPTRYRPSSEALLRRLLKGGEIPHIHPLVDLNNCLSADLAVPCCVMDERAVTPPFTFRSGTKEESYESLKGPFALEGRPLLVDARGPCDAPITGSERVKVGGDTARAWLVAYLPASVVAPHETDRRLRELLDAAPVAALHGRGSSA